MALLRETIRDIKNDFPNGKVSLLLFIRYYWFSPGFRVLLNYRIGKYFSKSKNIFFRLLGKYYETRMIVKRNCDISYNASIGKNLKMPHPIGIVIGNGVVIKDNVKIFQQVTFGSHGKKGEEQKYPIIESGVRIYAGAKIIGGITIGENAIIGANSVVNIDVPANTAAVGIPCKIINKQ